jgi:hypothetical protein
MTPAEDARVPIAVAPAAALAARPRLLGALEALLPVRFVADGAEEAAGRVVFAGGDDGDGAEEAAGRVVFAGGAEGDGAADAAGRVASGAGERGGSARVPELVLGDAPERAAEAVAVAIGDDVFVDRRLRGATLHDRLDGPVLAVGDGERVLATGPDGAPAWVRDDAGDRERVASALPELGEDSIVYALLADRAIAVVALLQFLRARLGAARWLPAPLRAAIVFDDPNLRRRSYGFIDYAELAEHARKHGYHAAMAMIPIDAGRAHPRALELFAQRPGPLSLNIHGNDHNAAELLAPRADGDARAFAAQALRRVERFERRTGLSVDRVMMPPHGRCSQVMSQALGAVGFDALSAIHPLPWTNEWRRGPALTGMRPADFVGGCPVIPRMPLQATASDVALRAFLEHPVVLYGHHQDVAGGLEPLAEAARVVNALGDVTWTSAGEIALGNAQTRVVGGTLQVRAFSRRLLLARPEDACGVTVTAPEDAVEADALAGWSVDGGSVTPFGTALEIPAAGERPLTLRLHGAGDVRADELRLPTWQPWPKLRRIATEARDRVAPLRGQRAA